ncbi:Uncharacterized protein TCM_030881 [Theobroma cacao]|uniref:Uncharacterized protein n=1 Tax=Theobroma cacao TaxID=3641 RepID=A0A061F6M4_THECC|nr:Uncharacterized protein TCM_030881 [Theobroma cacao]
MIISISGSTSESESKSDPDEPSAFTASSSFSLLSSLTQKVLALNPKVPNTPTLLASTTIPISIGTIDPGNLQKAFVLILGIRVRARLGETPGSMSSWHHRSCQVRVDHSQSHSAI